MDKQIEPDAGTQEDAATANARVQELCDVVCGLEERGEISPAHAQQLLYAIPQEYGDSRYVIKHFGVHLSIGAIFAFDLVPLPLGTIARVGWVAVARMTETLRGNFERARIHSLKVLLIAAIPWLGYVAYLFPLRNNGRAVAFALANETWLARRDHSYEQFVNSRSRLGTRFARWLVPLPWERG